MPASVSSGPTSYKAYAGLIAETGGSEGVYLAPTAQIPIDGYTLNQAGGTKGIDPLAGSRLANLAIMSDELKVSGTITGPLTTTAALLDAALAGAAGEASFYSLELNLGGATSARVAGALIDKYTIKGAVGGRVDYTASFVAQSATTGAAGSPTAPAVAIYGLKSVAITGGLALIAVATAFEVTIDNGAKTQPVYNGTVVPKYVFATTHNVTGKFTAVATGAGDIATIAAGTTVAVTITLSNGATKTLTLADCRITAVGNAARVGNLTMQDVDFFATAIGSLPLVVS